MFLNYWRYDGTLIERLLIRANYRTFLFIQFAVGDYLAGRFSPDIGPFASARDDTPESLSALAKLVPAGGNIIVLQVNPIKLPAGSIAVTTAFGAQMALDRLVPSNSEINKRIAPSAIKRLLKWWPLLSSLIRPFETGTARLSQFWGIIILGY